MTIFRRSSAIIVSGLLLAQALGTASAATPPAQTASKAPNAPAGHFAGKTPTKAVPFTPSKTLTTALEQARAQQLNLDTVRAAAAKKLQSKAQQVPGFVPGDNSAGAGLHKPDDIVRVVVELQGQSAAEKAATMGLRLQTADASLSLAAEQDAASQRDSVVSAARSGGVSLKVRHTYGTAIKGFSAEMRFGDLEKLQQTAGVKHASVAQEYVPLDNNSTEMVGALSLWNADPVVDGTGTTIAIIDTGVDYRHPDMGGQSKLDANGKVIGGWNFADNSSQVLDFSGSGHGTHVAGIAAATGDGPQHIKGMAPKAKIIAQKVFSNEGATKSAWTDDLVAAIDDAMNRNSPHHKGVVADVLNMSLGSVSGFADANDPEQKAIANAVNGGAVAAISAGNSSYNTSSNFYPYYWNQDVQALGSPGTAPQAITVASSQNSVVTIQGRGILATIDGTKYSGGNPTVYLEGSGKYGAFQTLGGTSQFVAIPSGDAKGCAAADWNGVSLTGKIALIKRGTCTFQLKTDNASAAGAKGVIIYNNQPDPDITSMAVDAAKVPSVMVMNSIGTELYNAIHDSHSEVKVGFNGQMQNLQMADTKSDTISSFSSWGTTPDLGFKPDLTAPGGNIFSTLPNGQYGIMNGTSMAAPHVAGAAALVKQAHHDFSPADIKAALMNTSKVLISPANENPYSPRQQGAGRIQVDKAVATNVVVTVNNSPSLALGAVPFGSTTPFTLTLKNNGTTDATFDLSGSVFAPGAAGPFNVMMDEALTGAGVTFGATSVTVPANQSITVGAALDLASAVTPGQAYYGYFAEGFIKLASQTPGQPDLSLPYMGYVGEWVGQNAPPIVDPMANDGNSYFGTTGLYAPAGSHGFNALGVALDDSFYPDQMAISTNAAASSQTSVYPALSLLRNAQSMSISVMDDYGKVVEKIAAEQNMRNVAAAEYYLGAWKWDGKAYDRITGKRKPVADGRYYVQVDTMSPGATAGNGQTYTMPLKVDSVAPNVYFYSQMPTVGGKYTLSWEAWDDFTGVYAVVPTMDGKLIGDFISPDIYSTEINIPSGKHEQLGLCAIDYAGNTGCYGFEGSIDLNGITAVGDTNITTNKSTVSLAYTIPATIHLVTYQEGESEAVAVELNPDTGLPLSKIDVSLSKDGVTNFIVKAYTDAAGTELAGEVTYTINVDMTPPVLEFTSPEARATFGTTSIPFAGTVTEAHPKADGIQYSTDEGKTWNKLVLDKDNHFSFTAKFTGTGRHNGMFKAEDSLGNVTELARAIYVAGGAPTITTALDPATGKAPANVDVLVSGRMDYTLRGTSAGDTGYSFAIDGGAQYSVDMDSTTPHDWSFTIAGLGGGPIFDDAFLKKAGVTAQSLKTPDFLHLPDLSHEVDQTVVKLEATDAIGATTQRTLTFKNKANVITIDAQENPVKRIITVNGKVTSDVTGVTVNGKTAAVTNGAFRIELPLQTGRNEIIAVATTKDPARLGLALSEVNGAAVVITSPKFEFTKGHDGLVTVKGSVDPLFKDTLVVNGTPVPAAQIAANGEFTVDIANDFMSGPFAPEGIYFIVATITDQSGNTQSDWSLFGYDVAAPVLTVTLPDTTVFQDSVTVGIDVTDSFLQSVQVNGQKVDLHGSGHYDVPVALSTDGDVAIKVEATDWIGNVTTETRTIVVDGKAPELNVSLNNGQAYSSPVKVAGTVKDAHMQTATVDGNEVPVITVQLDNGEPLTVTVGTDGKFTTDVVMTQSGVITVVAQDTYGHTTSKSFNIVLSQLLKSLNVSPSGVWSPLTGRLTADYEIAGKAAVTLAVYNMDGKLQTTLYTGTRNPGKYSAPWDGRVGGRVVADGEYNIVLSAGTVSLTRKITVDGTKPTNPTLNTDVDSINNDASWSIYGSANGAATVTISVSGPTRIASQTVNVDDGFQATFDMKAANAKDGVYTFTAVSKDVAGNLSAAGTLKITRKAAAPAKPTVVAPKVVKSSSIDLAVTVPENGTLTIHSMNGLAIGDQSTFGTRQPDLQVGVNAAKRNAKVSLALPDGANPDDLNWLDDGQYDFTAVLTDVAGNTSAETTFSFVVDRTGPKVAITSAATGAKGKSYSLAGKVSDSNGIASLKINGSTVSVRGDGTFTFAKVLPTTAGTVTTFTIVVTDKLGNVTTQTFDVTAQ